MKKRVMRGQEKWTEHTRDLPALSPGSRVLIQNQYGVGKAAKRWDKSGLVLEDLGYNKYRVKVDGSGRVTDRNRQFLKQFTPVTPGMPGPTPNTVPQSSNQQPFDPIPEPELPKPVVNTGPSTSIAPTPQFEDVTESPASPSYVTQPSSPVQSPDIPEASGPTPKPMTLPTKEPEIEHPVRRSTRIRKPPKKYNPAEYDLS